MAVRLTEEQRAFGAAVREFAERYRRDREPSAVVLAHDPEVYQRIADLGWFGVAIPEQYGGAGGGMVDACVFLEEAGRSRLPIAGYTVSLIVAGAYQRFGTEAQRKEMLGGIAAGSVKAIAMSEPGAGSDVGSLTCRAEAVDGGFVVNGQKTWISAAQHADHILLIARTGRGATKHEGLTMLAVPAGAPGMDIRPIATMAGPDEVNDLYFTDCFVPADAVLGTVDGAWLQLMLGLNAERLIIAAMYLGIAQGAFEYTLDYIGQREQFGRPIGKFQTVRHRIADLATELECCRLLVYDVAATVDEEPDRMLPREASMAKLKVTEVAKRIALEGMQLMGGYGYATEYDAEKYVRATLVSTIFGGTSEIQREIIAKTYGL